MAGKMLIKIPPFLSFSFSCAPFQRSTPPLPYVFPSLLLSAPNEPPRWQCSNTDDSVIILISIERFNEKRKRLTATRIRLTLRTHINDRIENTIKRDPREAVRMIIKS